MISDFYQAVLKSREAESIKEKEEEKKAAENCQDNRPILQSGAKELAASIITQNEPKPQKFLTPQEQADNKARGEKYITEAMKRNGIIQA